MTRQIIAELAAIRGRLDALFEDQRIDVGKGGWSVLVDLFEDPEGFTLQAELPGVDETSLKIEVEGRCIMLRARRGADEGERVHHRIERSSGTLRRQVELPAEVEREVVRAALEDGVLTLRLRRAR